MFNVFLQLLSKPKFSAVEKIKTIGSTYMAAAGLSGTPGQENHQVGLNSAWGLESGQGQTSCFKQGLNVRGIVMMVCFQDTERQQAQIGIMVEFAIAMMGKLDGINRHSFNSFRLRVGECAQPLH